MSAHLCPGARRSAPSRISHDVRGFEVRTRDDDDKVGRVSDLICTDGGQIRYLDVDLGGFFNPRHVALPIGAAQVDRSNDVVWITGLTKDEIKALPDHNGDARSIDSDYERRIAELSTRTGADTLYDQGRFYAARTGEGAREARLLLSEEQLAINKRPVQVGEVGVRKTVETEHVRETVPVMREEVVVERRPVVKEVIVVRKRAKRDTRVVEGDVRRERIEVEKRGDVN
jgi:stress response protein YsnF